MAPPTLSGLLITVLTEHAGTCVGRLAARSPRVAYAALRTLERAGVDGAGWALLALELAIRTDGGAQ